MLFFDDFSQVKNALDGCVLTIGNFDGIHLGHQRLIELCEKSAKTKGVMAAVLTFTPHPSQIISHQNVKLLMTDEQKKQKLVDLKLDAVIFQKFSLDFSKISAQNFLQKVLIDGLKVSEVIVGYNFKFGHQGMGSAALLKEQLGSHGILTQIVSPVLINDEVCSSSLIRQLLSEGKVEKAARFLGRNYSLQGTVIHGEKRGKHIGFPSATLQTKQKLILSMGVYETLVRLPGEKEFLLGATNIGRRPTFKSNDEIHIETHVLNFDREIYGQPMELFFVKKIRDEMKFNSVHELRRQINLDVQLISLK